MWDHLIHELNFMKIVWLLFPSTWLYDLTILHSLWSWNLTWNGWRVRGDVIRRPNNFEWQWLSFSCSQLSIYIYVVPWLDQIAYFYNGKEIIINCVNGFCETSSQSNFSKHPQFGINFCFYHLLNWLLNMSHDS